MRSNIYLAALTAPVVWILLYRLASDRIPFISISKAICDLMSTITSANKRV